MENAKLYKDLVQAVRSNNLSAVEECFKKVPDINLWTIDEDKALTYAVFYGHKETAAILLEKGAKLDLQDKSGNTALMLAAQEGHTDTMNYLLEKGANTDLQNHDGKTALMLAVEQDDMDDINIVDKLVDKGAKLDLQDKSGDTALMLAAQEGHTDTMNYLLEKGANTDLQNHDGKTALMLAVEQDIDAYITNLQDKIDLIALSKILRSNTLSTKRSVPSRSNAKISIQKIKEKRDLGRKV